MARESSLWDTVRVNLAPFADLVRVENAVEAGTPDVNYCLHGGKGEGWIELKDADAWPARADTLLRLDHVTTVQREWWLRRRRAGGRCFVLLRVGYDYLLFDGVAAALALGRAPRQSLIETAVVVGLGRFPRAPLLRELSQPPA